MVWTENTGKELCKGLGKGDLKTPVNILLLDLTDLDSFESIVKTVDTEGREGVGFTGFRFYTFLSLLFCTRGVLI